MSLETMKLPLSQKVKCEIIDYIHSTGIKKDEALPSENDFSVLLDVSRQTVREALALLELEKIVYKVQGKGTFLRRIPSTIQTGLEKLESVTEMIRKSGLEPRTIWIGIEVEDPTDIMVRELEISRTDKVVTFKRLRTANGEFVSYCVDSIPQKLLSFIPRAVESESLMYYLGKEMDLVFESAKSVVTAVMPSEDILRHFDLGGSKPLLLLEQTHFNPDYRPIAYSRDYYDTDIIKFKINRER
jgi:GntR family transcriptional regulator